MEDSIWGLGAAGAAGTISGIIGTVIIGLFREKKKADLDENAQAFQLYKEIIGTLKQDIQNLKEDFRTLEKKYKDDIEKLQNNHAQCQQENVSLRGEIAKLQAQVDHLLKSQPSVPKVG